MLSRPGIFTVLRLDRRLFAERAVFQQRNLPCVSGKLYGSKLEVAQLPSILPEKFVSFVIFFFVAAMLAEVEHRWYDGRGGKNFSDESGNHPRIWTCLDQPLAEGGLTCCDIAAFQVDQREKSCCPQDGGGSINHFSIGSEFGSPVVLITKSPSSVPTLSLL